MPIYIFYQRNIELKVIEQDELTPHEMEKLMKEGLTKLTYETEAQSKDEAIGKLIKYSQEDLDATREFNKDIKASSVSSIVESLLR